jgi:hypothetical protein
MSNHFTSLALALALAFPPLGRARSRPPGAPTAGEPQHRDHDRADAATPRGAEDSRTDHRLPVSALKIFAIPCLTVQSPTTNCESLMVRVIADRLAIQL